MPLVKSLLTITKHKHWQPSLTSLEPDPQTQWIEPMKVPARSSAWLHSGGVPPWQRWRCLVSVCSQLCGGVKLSWWRQPAALSNTGTLPGAQICWEQLGTPGRHPKDLRILSIYLKVMRLDINKCSALSSSLLASKPVHTKSFKFTVALLRRELKKNKNNNAKIPLHWFHQSKALGEIKTHMRLRIKS